MWSAKSSWPSTRAQRPGATAPPCPVWWPRRTGKPPVGCVLADAEFDSERNHTFCREHLKANSVIPAKRFTSRRATGVRAEMRENFPRELYAKRSLCTRVSSRPSSASSPAALPDGRSLHTQTRQALLLGLAFDFYRLRLPPI